MGDRCLPLLFVVDIPKIPIEERDYERRAEKKGCRANVVSPSSFYSVERCGGIKREGETEELKEDSKSHTRATLKEPTNCQRDKERPDENKRRDERLLRCQQIVKHASTPEYQGEHDWDKCRGTQ